MRHRPFPRLNTIGAATAILIPVGFLIWLGVSVSAAYLENGPAPTPIEVTYIQPPPRNEAAFIQSERRRWEYKIERVILSDLSGIGQPPRWLEILGYDGWEMIDVHRDDTRTTIIFKRLQ